MGQILRETGCRRVSYVNGSSSNLPAIHSQSRRNLLLIVLNSDPHITDLGGMESEPAFGRYSPNLLQCWLGFKFRHRGPIY